MNITEDAIRDIFLFSKNLEFGEIVIKVQDARIVSVEKHEKIRLNKTADSSKSGEAKFNR